MRQIGILPRTANPQAFGDYLLAQGVTSRAIESKDGWAIWVHNEDHVPRAREALAVFEKDPSDPRFLDAAREADAARRAAEKLDRQYRKNVRELSGTLDRIPLRRRPLTVFLVATCVALFVAERTSIEARIWLADNFRFFPLALMLQPHDLTHSLDAIHRGQVWRLVTPIFLHGDYMHLLFNMWAIWIEGTIIETRRGTQSLAVLVLLSAVTSNVGQYLYMLNMDQKLVPWVGISGVGFAMLGYLWMKGQVDPEPGMVLHPSTVRVMLLWLMLGFTGLFSMANGAHLAGLVVGMLYGLARF